MIIKLSKNNVSLYLDTKHPSFVNSLEENLSKYLDLKIEFIGSSCEEPNSNIFRSLQNIMKARSLT